MELIVVDHECSTLKGDQGFLLCSGYKPLGKAPCVVTYHETGFGPGRLTIDKPLAAMVRDSMEAYDGWITWNGLLFDLPYLDDRLMLCGERPRQPRFARGLDMMWHSKMGKSTFQSARLDWVAKSMGCPFKKTDLSMPRWKEAEAEVLVRFAHGHENYDYIVTHCRQDLKVTEWVYNKLKHRIQNISKR
jgi:uncharacterized protein YprB with RNaseH-like and TPR domain